MNTHRLVSYIDEHAGWRYRGDVTCDLITARSEQLLLACVAL